jgi:hypothetical protein
MENQIAQRGSLTLTHFEGDDREPETFMVHLTEKPSVCASLQAAADWNELSDMRGQTVMLNGSQKQTVMAWLDEYL